MNALDKDSARPIYLQLEDLLRQQIETGQLNPGDRMPSEMELAAMYGISRMTARRATDSLVTDGLLLRQPGKGTFVANPKVPFPGVTISSFSHSMRVLGLSVTSRVLDLELIPAVPQVAHELHLSPDQPVVFLRRLRLINHEPMALMSSYMHGSFYEALQNADLSNRPITQIMEEASGVKPAFSRDHIEASLAHSEEAELLAIRKGAPVLLLRGVIYEANGTPVRFSKVVYRADRFRLSLSAEYGNQGTDNQVKLPDPRLKVDAQADQWLTLAFNLAE